MLKNRFEITNKLDKEFSYESIILLEHEKLLLIELVDIKRNKKGTATEYISKINYDFDLQDYIKNDCGVTISFDDFIIITDDYGDGFIVIKSENDIMSIGGTYIYSKQLKKVIIDKIKLFKLETINILNNKYEWL